MSETGQGRSPPSPSLPALLFMSPTWQISAPTLQLPFLVPTRTHAHAHAFIYCCCREGAQGTHCSGSTAWFSYVHMWAMQHDTFHHMREKTNTDTQTEQGCLAALVT